MSNNLENFSLSLYARDASVDFCVNEEALDLKYLPISYALLIMS